MTHPRRKRLSWKQARNTILAGLALGVLFSGIQIGYDLSQVARSSRERLRPVLETARQAGAKAAYELSLSLAHEVVKGLMLQPAIREVILRDDFGGVLAMERRARAAYPESRLSEWIMGDHRQVTLPLLRRGRAVGHLEVTLDPGVITGDFVSRSAISLASTLAYTLLLTLVLTWLFYNSVTRLLQDMARETAAVDPSHPDRVRLSIPTGHGDDEMGQLARAINSLLAGFAGALAVLRVAEIELRDREQRLRAIFESAEDVGFIIFDADPDHPLIREFSPGAQRIFGLERAEMMGRPVWMLHPEGGPRLYRQALEGMARGEGGLAGETQLSRGSGQEFPALYTTYPLKDATGRIYAALGVAVDLSHQRRLEEQLRQAQKMQALGTLAGGIAHDFNNILAAITGYTELAMAEMEDGRPSPKELEQVLRSAQRAKDLIGQILAFSRGERLLIRPLDLNQVVTEAAGLLERTLPKMIAIELNLDPDLPSVGGDPAQLEQIVLNLGGNARDAMPRGGRLRLITRMVALDQDYCQHHLEVSPGPYALLEVVDTGQGMDPETAARAFEPFFTTKELGRGTGLGLSTVYGIVKSHGGHVSCYSQPGRGTSFKVYLPFASSEALDETHGPDSALVGGDETLLLVDDEAALRQVGSGILSREGYQVLTAASGEEALETLDHHPGRVDLIILDMGMPGMGGAGCLARLMERKEGTRVVITSGYAPDGQMAETLSSPLVAGFLAKPFTRADVLTTVRQALDAGEDEGNAPGPAAPEKA